MADSKVLIEVIATSKGIKVVSKDTEQLVKTTRTLTQEQKKQNKQQTQLNKTKDKTNKKDKSLYQGNLSASKGFSKMKETLGSQSSGLVQAYATLAANVFAATAAFTALRQASQVQQLIQGLEVLGSASGKNLGLLADKIKEASGNAIALDQAMRTASVGASAGFDPSQIKGLAAVARDAAIALGRDVGDAVDRLTRGAAKLEPEILDELGIFVRLDDASAKYAASIGVAASELTRFQQRQAFANEIIEQGEQKFGALAGKVDASPFDRLSATLGDLSRGVMDFFNSVLSPFAGFLANNTVALGGLFLILTKGIITQALPALNNFSKTAQAAATRSKQAAETEIKSNNRIIQQQRKRLQPLKMIRGEMSLLYKKIKSGTATIAEQELFQKKLDGSIKVRNKNIQDGNLKNIKLKQIELQQLREMKTATLDLINTESKRSIAGAKAQTFTATGNFERRGGNILGKLDEDIAGGNILGGFDKAIKSSRRNSKKLLKDTRAVTGQMRILGVTAGPKLSKNLRLAGASMKVFGLSGKIAIKGLFTAIPVIGQLLLVIDLLIAGLKGAINFLAGFGGEMTKAEKAAKDYEKALAGVKEMTSIAALANKSAADSMVIQANATSTLIDATKEQSEQQAKAREEAGILGKVLIALRNDVEIFGMRLGVALRGTVRFFREMGLNAEQAGLHVKVAMAGAYNAVARFFNLFLDDSEKIELITDDDVTAAKKRIDEIQNIQIAAANAAKNQVNQATLSILGDSLVTSSEFKSLNTIIGQGGDAAKELKESLGVENINVFASNLDTARTSLKGFKGTSEELQGILDKELGPGVGGLAKNFVKLSKDGVESFDILGLIGAVLEEGTKQTVSSGKAVEELGNTFKNSGEKINNFFTGFREKSSLTATLSEFKGINDLVEDITKNEDKGIEAFLQKWEEAPASLRKFVDNGEEIKTVLGQITAKEKEATEARGVGDLDKVAKIEKEILELNKQLGPLRIAGSEALEETIRKLVKIELIEKKRAMLLTQQANALKKVKNNGVAVEAQVIRQNQATQITLDGLQTQTKMYEQNMGLSAGQVLNEQEIGKLTEEQREQYGKILTNRVNIAKNQEKLVSDEEKGLLIRQAGLSTLQASNQLLTAQAATAAKLLSYQQKQASIARGTGGSLTEAEKLKAQKTAAREAVKAAVREQAFQITKFEIERDILKMRLLAAKVDEEAVIKIIARMNKNFETQKLITAEKLKQKRIDEAGVGQGDFKGLLSGGAGQNLIAGAGLFREQIGKQTTYDADGNKTGERDATSQEKLEAMNTALAPMREQLMSMGPEGELVATAQQGILTLASAFDVVSSAGLGSAEGMAAVGSAIASVSSIMAANSKAQIAEIDAQIAAEKKRDGKSVDSLNKIKGMEKKKEAMERKAFERNKKMQMAQTVANTAASIMGVMSGVKDPFVSAPLAIAQAAMFAVMGAAQLAVISKQKYDGGSSSIEKPQTNLSIGKRSNAVDVSKAATAGELNYLRGGRTTGGGLGGAGGGLPGASMGRRGYADGGVVVGERGPEVITPTTQVDVTPNYALSGGETNVNFTINAVDSAGVEDVLMNQRGNIIRMIREAANDHGQMFLEDIDTQTYGSNT